MCVCQIHTDFVNETKLNKPRFVGDIVVKGTLAFMYHPNQRFPVFKMWIKHFLFIGKTSFFLFVKFLADVVEECDFAKGICKWLAQREEKHWKVAKFDIPLASKGNILSFHITAGFSNESYPVGMREKGKERDLWPGTKTFPLASSINDRKCSCYYIFTNFISASGQDLFR